jgi:hypothetical protein
VLCIDQGETHILEEEYLPLIACHSSKEMHHENKAHPTTLAASEEHHGNPCVDIALKSQESSIFRYTLAKATPKAAVPSVLTSSYLSRLTSSYYHDPTPTPFYKYPRTLQLTSLRTVVLLI